MYLRIMPRIYTQFFPSKKPFSWQFNFISKQLHFLNCIFIFGYELATEDTSSQILMRLLQRVTLDPTTDYWQWTFESNAVNNDYESMWFKRW